MGLNYKLKTEIYDPTRNPPLYARPAYRLRPRARPTVGKTPHSSPTPHCRLPCGRLWGHTSITRNLKTMTITLYWGYYFCDYRGNSLGIARTRMEALHKALARLELLKS